MVEMSLMNTICKKARLFVLIMVAALQALASTHAAVISVTNTNDSLSGSLRQAIQDATSGDTIHFQIPTSDPGYNPATRTFTINLTSDTLTISKSLSILGGTSRVVVRRGATASFRIFTITAGNVTLENLMIQDGQDSVDGGGNIRNLGNLVVRGCTIYNGSTTNGGGGIRNEGVLFLVNSTITQNTGTSGSGILNTSSLTVRSCTIANNLRASADPAYGIYNAPAGTARVGNNIISGNDQSNPSRSDVSGAFTSEGYNLTGTLNGATGFGTTGDQVGATSGQIALGPLQDNGGPTLTMKPAAGKAIDQGKQGVDSNNQPINTDQRGQPRPVDLPVPNAAGGDGSDVGAFEGGPPQTGPTFTVTATSEHDDGGCTTDDCTLVEALNAANANADANTINFIPGLTGTIFNTLSTFGLNIASPVTINGPGASLLTISGNNALPVFDVGTGVVKLSGLTIANGNGGGIVNSSGNLTVTDCVVRGNTSSGIRNSNGSVTLINCAVIGNTGDSGGGIYSSGNSGGGSARLVIKNSTISGNVASGNMGAGGGIYNEANNGRLGSGSTAALTMTNCTVTGNAAPNNPSSAGLKNNAFGGTTDATLTNCTFSSSAIDNDHAILTAVNTIFDAGTGGATITNTSGTVTSKGHNLSSDAAGGFLTASGDQPNTNPKLDTLKNNGGPTDTMALLSDSPARDAGDDSFAPATDQRVYSRSGVSDIGAFEFNGMAVPPPTTLANISTRLPVGIGDNALIAGFIVTGTQPKKVIIRALGPSLGFADGLTNPILELRDGSGALLETNDNWINSPNKQAIIESTIAPRDSAESAIVRSVDPGNYTAIERGVNNGTGIGVIEVYDLDTYANSKLANISTRGLVQTGDNVLIAGTIAAGQTPQKVIVEALGPSLSVPGHLADPTLELRDGNGTLLDQNDNWIDSPNKQAIIDSTIPPTNDFESAIIATLPAGGAQYTAIVRGVNNAMGVAVVEVFALQ